MSDQDILKLHYSDWDLPIDGRELTIIDLSHDPDLKSYCNDQHQNHIKIIKEIFNLTE
jgi:hypothetical protein